MNIMRNENLGSTSIKLNNASGKLYEKRIKADA